MTHVDDLEELAEWKEERRRIFEVIIEALIIVAKTEGKA